MTNHNASFEEAIAAPLVGWRKVHVISTSAAFFVCLGMVSFIIVWGGALMNYDASYNPLVFSGAGIAAALIALATFAHSKLKNIDSE